MAYSVSLLFSVLLLFALVLCSDIYFPTSHAQDKDNKIPLDVILRLSALENFTQFVDFVDEQSLVELESGIVNRFGDDEVGRKAVTIPKNAICTPELQVIELIKEKDPSLVYFPACTRLEQCGGCCTSELLKCWPTETETVNYMIYVASYGNGGKFKVQDKMIVPVERHLACKCSCAVRKEDCSRMQEYDEDKCQCKCFNTDDEQKCKTENATKIWDSNKCMCTCRQTLQCSTGSKFDHNTCGCSEMTTRRRHVTDDESRYLGESKRRHAPLPVLPLHHN